MKLDVVIPTYRRAEKLKRCIESVQIAKRHLFGVRVDIHVYFSSVSELEVFQATPLGKTCYYHLLEKEFKPPVFWNDRLRYMTADALCYLTDDVVLDPMCLVKAWNELLRLRLDGVVGFEISNATDGQPAKAAFSMIGRHYRNRFPEAKVFCPEYWCFYLDTELEMYASSINKFIFCKDTKLSHAHPVFLKAEPDECHKHHRRNSDKDVAMWAIRRAEKLLWGKSFELIGEDT